MNTAARLLRPTALTLLIVASLCCNCDFKPPTPVISGPDSGWARAPVLLTAEPLEGAPAWNWGDGEYGTTSDHEYSQPGTYSVVCQVLRSSVFFGLGNPILSNPSTPFSLRIVEDTLIYPDTIVATIAIGQGSRNWACILPDGSRLYATNAATDTVSVIDTHTNAIAAAIAIPDSPTCCVASNSGLYVYVSSFGARTVAVISTQGDSVLRTIPTGGPPGRLAILPNDSLLYVARTDSSIVLVIRTSDDSCMARVAVNGVPTGITVKPGGDFVYAVSEADNGITVIRTSDNAIVHSATLSGGPSDILFSPGGETAYVVCPIASSIVVLRVADLAALGEASFDSLDFDEPRLTAMLPGGRCLYVASGAWFGHTAAIVRRSDNYLLRRYRRPYPQGGGTGMPIPHPDGSKVYFPATDGIVVLGLRPSR